jgi:hypothetical protein
MNGKENSLAKHVMILFKNEGLKGLFRRIRNRLPSKKDQYHASVLTSTNEAISNSLVFPTALDPLVVRALERAQRLLNSLEFKEITLADIGEIDELTSIDHWKLPKSANLERLGEGWHCYVAKYKGRIMANTWTKSGPEIYEPFLGRSFTLRENEVYTYRTFCVPEFRGRGVSPWFTNCISNHLALTEGVKNFVGLVKTDNVGQLRTLLQSGWTILGRVGFIDIDIFGIRIHYIWGRRAFCSTRKRFSINFKN